MYSSGYNYQKGHEKKKSSRIMRSHSSESEEENRVPNNKDLLHLPTIQKLKRKVTNFNRKLSHHLAEDEPPEDSR